MVNLRLCCTCNDFSSLFFGQLLDIGGSSGSIFIEAINLFRTFQRLSATKSFAAKFSDNCLKMFQWAKDIIQIIVDKFFRVIPFTDFELFSIYNYVFPIVILTYFTMINVSQYVQTFTYFIFYIIVFLLGIGLGFFGLFTIGAISITAISLFIGLIFIAVTLCCCKSKSKKLKIDIMMNKEDGRIDKETEKYDRWLFGNKLAPFISTRATFISVIILTVLMFQFTMNRFKLQIAVEILSIILVIASVIIEYIFYEVIILITELYIKLTFFLANFLSLLTVPQAESFVTLLQGNHHKKWNIFVGYIFNSFIIPILINILMIFCYSKKVVSKYKDRNGFKFSCLVIIEMIDTVRKIAFALVSAFDIIWACVGIEVFWLILVIATRPYKNVSDYFISIGESLIVLASNSAILVSNYTDKKVFNFTITLIIVFLACLPTVLALIFYFVCDFETEIKDDLDSDYGDDEDSALLMNLFGMIALPITCLTFGMNMPMVALNKIDIT